MRAIPDPAAVLATRLLDLRKRHWPGIVITQSQLAQALGARKPASVPLISSWENVSRPVVPPEERLAAYASFFATRRSVECVPYQLLSDDDLDDLERSRRDDLCKELYELRAAAVPPEPSAALSPGSPWHFRDHNVVTIVCANLPLEMRSKMPYTDPSDPDYTDLFTFADLDSLFELHGHIRAVNPATEVRYRSASALVPDDYATHLVVLGGVDWNVATRDLLQRLRVPVTQVSNDVDPDRGYFAVVGADPPQRFRPVLAGDEHSRRTLVEDVAHLYRAPNPLNQERTVTICNGMFSRGVLGAVRALTDANFRDRNSEYIRQRFAGGDTYSILARVQIVNGAVVTPDWTRSDTRLHEWPEYLPAATVVVA
jgi:transcriptional regulator with XRE-family HTH domain